MTTKEIIQTNNVFTGTIHAPVNIVCYMDYESVACAKLNEMLNELLLHYYEQVNINIRHFPLAQIHQKAMKAAEAVVAAAQEGLFWPMHNMLFANQKKLGVISLKEYAKEIGTTNKRFLDQVINGTYAWQVRDDLLHGIKLGIREVPAIFLNNERLEGEVTMERLEGYMNKP